MIDNTPTPDPVMQPVSMHDAPHKHHGALPLVAAMLGVFLVIETVVLGYVVKEYVMSADDQANPAVGLRDQLEERIREVRDKIPPVLFTVKQEGGYPYGQDLISIDRVTGQEIGVYSAGIGGFVEPIAVPQVKYDGTVYVHLVGEGDDPFIHLHSLDLTRDSDPQPMEWENGTVIYDGFSVSPDQTMIAYVPYDFELEKEFTGNELMVLDLATGESKSLGKANEGEGYFYEYILDLGGVGSGYQLRWIDRNCVEAVVYNLPETDSTAETNSFSKMETFCVVEPRP
jgi:hypothetical protein